MSISPVRGRVFSSFPFGPVSILSLVIGLAPFLLQAECGAQGAKDEPRYVFFQFGGTESETPIQPLLAGLVKDLKDQFGAQPPGANRYVGFTPGLFFSLNWPADMLRSRVNEALDLAEATGMPVFFHMDDMHFWWNCKELHADPHAVEWSDFPKPGEDHGPIIARYWLNWGSWVVFDAPPPNFESPRFRAYAARQLTDGFGKPIAERLARWRAEGKEYLFAGIAVGNETEVPYDLRPVRDAPAGQEPVAAGGPHQPGDQIRMRREEMVRGGYAALSTRGYTRQKVQALAAERNMTEDQVVTELRFEAAHDYAEFRCKTLCDAGIPRDRIYTHFVSAMRSFVEKRHGEPMVDRLPPVRYSVNPYSRPGYTVTRETADLPDLIAKIRASREAEAAPAPDAAWAAVETYPTIAQPGRPQTREEYEAYLGGLFAREMRLINVYGWSIPPHDHGPFSVKDAPGVMEAIRAWVTGKELPVDWRGESLASAGRTAGGAPGQPRPPPQRIQEKMQRLGPAVEKWVRAGGDPSKIAPLGENLRRLMEQGKIDEVEKAVDAIFELVGSPPGKSSGTEDTMPGIGGKDTAAGGVASLYSEEKIPAVLRQAQWLWCEGEPVPQNFYLYLRKRFQAPGDVAGARVHVTADSRYKLFVNGEFVGRGPARADQRWQYFETFDITGHLRPGENVISAIVHQYGAPTHSYTVGRGGFLLGGVLEAAGGQRQTLTTDDSWRVLPAPTWKRPTPRVCPAVMWMEEYDARNEIPGWQEPGYDDHAWQKPVLLGTHPVSPWLRLVPRDIPPLLEEEMPAAAIVDAGTVGSAPRGATVNLSKELGDQPGNVAYLASWLRSSADRRVRLFLSDFGLPMMQQVWLNGEPVGREMGNAFLSARLREGWNVLVVKTVRMGPDWKFGVTLIPVEANGADVTWHAARGGNGDENTALLFGPIGSAPVPGMPGMPPSPAFAQVSPLEEMLRRGEPDSAMLEKAKRVDLVWKPQENVALQMAFEPLESDRTKGPQHSDNLVRPGAGPAIVPTKESDAGVYVVVDFGKEVSGYVRLALKGVAGGVVDLGYSEVFQDGRIDILREGPMYFADRYIMKDGPQKWELFFWKGFRYLQLDFRNCSAPVDVEKVSLLYTSYPVEYRGAFECSDPLLNRVWDVGRWTLRNCMHDAYEDTPWREQGQWLGDAQVEMLSDYVTFGATPLERKCLRQFAEGQTETGMIPANWPAAAILWRGPQAPPFGIPTFMCQWVSMILDHDRYTGDHELTKVLYPHVIRLLGYLQRFENDAGLLENVPGFVFLDWIAEPGFVDMPGGGRSGVLTGMNCHYHRALIDAAALASSQSDEARRLEWSRKAGRLKDAINDRLWSERDGLYVRGYRDGQLLPRLEVHDSILAIYAGVAPPDRMTRSLETLSGPKSADIVPMGSPYFYHFYLQALRKAGRPTQAIENIRRDYGKMLAAGATTWWEHFAGFASRSHAWSCGPSYDLPTYVLGVEPTAPAYEALRIAPQPGNLAWAKGVVPTVRGDIRVEWRRSNGRFELDAKVPMAAEVELSVPAASLETARCSAAPIRSDYRGGRARFWVQGPGAFSAAAVQARGDENGAPGADK
jgi:alpha-L-rhamnosidase